jgi:hypothetical protein
MDRITRMSPRSKARVAGVFDFLEGLMAVPGQVLIPGMLVVSGDAATTANNILGNELLFRVAFTAALLAVAFHIVWTLLFYELFKPVNPTISLLAAFVGLVGIAVQAVSAVFQGAPLVVLQSNGPFTAAQPQELALLLLDVRMEAFNIYIAFFGLWCVLTGYLIFKSTFMPRMIGVLEVMSGLCWLTNLWPPLANALFPSITGPLSAPGEFSVQLWLLIFGVNAQRWMDQAGAAGPADARTL